MKKALALLLVLVLALSMSTTAFAARGVLGKYEPDTATGKWNSDAIYSDNKVTTSFDMSPGGKLFLDLDRDFFYYEDHTATVVPASSGSLSKRDISDNKMSIRSKVKKGSVAIDSVYLDYYGTGNADSQIVVEMVEYFKSVDDLDFEVDVYWVIDGKAFTGETVSFSGNLDNDQEEIDADTYYAYMADGTVYEVKDYVREVEYELMDNGGVIVTGSAIKGQKYWGVALNEPTSAQADLMDKYDIAEVININTIGLDRIAKYVTLDIANPSDYVYNKDLKYLGKAGDELPFSTTYYLSATMLDVDEEVDEEPADIDPDDYEVPSASGGEDDSYLANVNDNPGTGK